MVGCYQVENFNHETTMKNKVINTFLPNPLKGRGSLLAMGAVLAALIAIPHGGSACDACNLVFHDQLMSERAGSLVSRDLQRAKENQRGLNLAEMVSPMAAERSGQTSAIRPRAASEVAGKKEGSDCCADCAESNGESAKGAGVERRNSGSPLSNGNGLPTPHQTTFPVGAEEAASFLLASAEANQPASSPAASRGNRSVPEFFEGDDFIEIIERDYAIPTRPTSYVPQDTEPDVSFTVELNEGQTYLGNGVVYDGFLMDEKIPGPTIIVNEGDIVEMNIVNTGIIPHGASIHSAYTQTSKYVGSIGAGQTKNVRFKATHPGVFMYHCAPGGHAIPMHVLAGQYGMMVVKPTEKKYRLEEELEQEPDIELYLIQHEIYASGKDAIEGNAAYTAFNGRLFRYVEEPIMARPGDYVRIYFLNIGPNLLSTFHIVGIIWDYAYWQGYPENIMTGGQTVTAGPSDSFVIEFRIPPDEGAYTMLSHAVGSTSRGVIGLIVADAEAEPEPVVLADGPTFSEEEMEENIEKAQRIVSPFGIGTHPVDEPVVYGPEVEEVHVSIIGNSYYPKVVQVAPGTTVTWTNEDVFTYLAGEYSGIHNVAATSHPDESEGFVSDLMVHGERFSYTFEFEGEYDYMCTPHPYMQARVIVKSPVSVVGGTATATSIGGWALPLLAVSLILATLAIFLARARKERSKG